MKTITVVIGTGAQPNIDWAEVRGWVTIAFAVIAAFFAWKAFQREKNRDRINRLMRVQAQAARVAMWRSVDGTLVFIKNASDLPVTQLKVIATSHVRPEAILRERAEVPIEDDATAPEGCLRYEELYGTLDPTAADAVPIQRLVDFEVAEVLASFTDAQGITWIRSESMILPTKSVRNPEWPDVIDQIDSRSRTEWTILITFVSISAASVALLVQHFFW